MQEGRISHNYLPYTSLFQVSLCVNSFWEFRHPSETQSCFLWAATHHLKSRSLKNVKTSCNELNYKSAAQSLTQELGLYRSSNPGQSLQNHWIVLHFFPVCYFSGTPFINGLLTCTILKFTLKRMVDYLFEVFLTLSGWNDFLCFPSCFWRCNWSSDLGLHFDCKRLKHCDLPIRIYWVLRYSTVSLLHPRFFLQICCSRNGRVHPLSFWHYRCLVFLYLKTPRVTPFPWSANALLFFLSLTLSGFEMQLFWGSRLPQTF